MRRFAVSLLVASGCELVFPLEAAEPVAVCGPYTVVEQQTFEPGLTAITDFSVDDTGASGFVMAKVDGAGRATLTPIKLAGGIWSRDMLRAGIPPSDLQTLTNIGGLVVGRSNGNGHLFASVRETATNRLRVFNFALVGGTTWAPIENLPILDTDASEETFAGGEIEINDGQGADRFFRDVPILHVTEDNTRFLSIAASEPAEQTWSELSDDGKLVTDAINVRHEVTQAAFGLFADELGPRLVLAYAAQDRGETDSKLFLSAKQKELFPVGAHLSELDEPGSELEPFLSRDCNTLYFRRADAIFKATVE